MTIGGYIAIEAAFRRRLVDLALRITLFLAVVVSIILAIDFAPLLIVLAIGGVALIAIVDNVRELRT